jgi:hypothetical protein
VSRPAHIFVLLLKTAVKAEVEAAVEAKILLLIILRSFVVVCNCLLLCAMSCLVRTTVLIIGRIYLCTKGDRLHFSPLKTTSNSNKSAY